MDFKDKYIIINDVFIKPETVISFSHHYGRGINCLEVLHGDSKVTRFYEEDMNDFLKKYNSYLLRNETNKLRSDMNATKPFPKLNGNTTKGIISVGTGLKNVVIDATTIQLIYFEDKSDKIKLNIMLWSQDKMFYLEDDLAIEFVTKYNKFLAE